MKSSRYNTEKFWHTYFPVLQTLWRGVSPEQLRWLDIRLQRMAISIIYEPGHNVLHILHQTKLTITKHNIPEGNSSSKLPFDAISMSLDDAVVIDSVVADSVLTSSYIISKIMIFIILASSNITLLWYLQNNF